MKLTNPGLLDRSVTWAKLASARALVRSNVNTSLASGVFTSPDWTLQQINEAGIHDLVVNPSRLTVPVGYTRAQLQAGAVFQANATGMRQLRFYKNGVLMSFAPGARIAGHATIALFVSLSTPFYDVVGGDFFEVKAHQDSGVALNVQGDDTTFFGILLLQ